MLKELIPVVLSLVLVLTACGPASQPETETQDDSLTVVATTYPVYLFTQEVARNVEGITVTCMVNQAVGCLHDYTLSVNDMKVLDSADLLVLSGAGLEDSMADAIASANCPQIDCSAGIELLEACHDHDHGAGEADHEHEHDNHIWMDPLRAGQMIQNLADGLAEADPANAETYQTNALAANAMIQEVHGVAAETLSGLTCRELITFHDGFAYFADSFDLTILRSIEEESGSEASAQEVAEILEEIEHHQLPAIFTEVNGSTATAEMIRRECGVAIFSLDMMMSGSTEGADGILTYLTGILSNAETIQEAYA